MKLKKFAILLLALLTLTVFTSGALAGTRIDTDAASLQTANASEAAAGQSGTVDGIISFDYNGKTYTYYHMNDGGSGYFLPVVYMQEALDAAFSLDTPSEAVQGYQRALESAMSAFLGGGTATDTPADTTQSTASDLNSVLGNSGSSSSSSSTASAAASSTSGSSSSSSSSTRTASGSAVDNSKDDPYGALTDSSSTSSSNASASSGSTPELGDESTPITVLAMIALLAAAGMFYARRRSMEV